MIRDLFRRPDSFMESKVGGIRIRWELLLLLVIGGLGSVGIAWGGLAILDFGVSESANFVIIGNVLAPVLGVVFIWVGYSVAVHLVANQFGGRGPIRRILKLAPYAMIPIAIGNVAKSGALYWVFENNLEIGTVLEDTPYRPTDAVMRAAHEDPIYAVAVVIGIVMVIWTGYLLSFAVEHAKNISREQSLRVAAVPVVLHALFEIWTLLGHLGVL